MPRGCTALHELISLFLGFARAQSGGSFDNRPKITVSGEAVVNVKPDKVVISLGIETSDSPNTLTMAVGRTSRVSDRGPQ